MPDITITTYEGATVNTDSLGYMVTVSEGLPPHDVPTGGTTGQRLVKASDADYDLEWMDGGGGGSTVTVDSDGTVTVDGTPVELATDTQLAAHEADTTNVHGITNTANLETTTGAQSKADLAEANAEATAATALAAHVAAADPHPVYLTAAEGNAAYDALGAAAAAAAASQPLDSDLTAIAALATTAFGRSLLELANAAAGRTALALGTAATSATGDFDAAGTAAAAVAAHEAASDPHPGYLTATEGNAAYQPLDSDLTALAALTTTAYGRAFLELANQAALMVLLSAASTTAQGIVELATSAETTTGTDTVRAVTPAGVKAVADTLAPLVHTHAAADITSGTIAPARLGSGSGGATKFLREDSSWQTVSAGGGAVASDAIWDAKGDLAVGTGADTAARLAVGTNEQIPKADSTESTGLRWADLFTRVINDDLSSTAGLMTALSGTWAINSGVLRQSNGSANPARITYSTVIPHLATFVRGIEVDAAHISSSGSIRRFGLYLSTDNTTAQTVMFLDSADGTSWTVKVEYDGSSAVYNGPSVSYGGSGYVKLGVVLREGASTGRADLYVGRTYITTISGINIGNTKTGFYTYSSVADFKNLKAWTPAPPWA